MQQRATRFVNPVSSSIFSSQRSNRLPATATSRALSSMTAPPPSYRRESELETLNFAPPHILQELRPINLRSASPNRVVSHKGTMKLHVPQHGCVILSPPSEPVDGHEGPPQEDTLLHGTLEVDMKERKRCKAIRVVLEAVVRLDMGEGRGWEQDGVFEREVVIGGGEEGIWLEQGLQTFEFTFIIPANCPVYDTHPRARMTTNLTAYAEGIDPPASTGFPFFGSASGSSKGKDKERASYRSPSSSRPSSPGPAIKSLPFGFGRASTSKVRSGSKSRTGATSQGPSRNQSRAGSRDNSPAPSPPLIAEQRSSSPGRMNGNAADSDRGRERDKDKSWLKGDMSTTRHLVIAVNPAAPSVNILDIKREGNQPGLGFWRMGLNSDAFSIASPLLFRFHAISPSPKCSIFHVRLSLTQKYTITSPRTPHLPPRCPDPPRTFTIHSAGREPLTKYPGKESEALWRGSEVDGGESLALGGEELKIKGVGRLPNDAQARPSTMDGTMTPIRVSHSFSLYIYFSIYGEDLVGQPLKQDGPGELRLLIIKTPVIVPSCCCTEQMLTLPSYQEDAKEIKHRAAPKMDLDKPVEQRQDLCACGAQVEELRERMEKLDMAGSGVDVGLLDVDEERGRARSKTAMPRTLSSG